MNSERNLNLDLLRILSAFAVVAIHVTTKSITDVSSLKSNVWMFSNIVNNASRFAVPMFFIISGYFTLNNNKNLNYSFFYKKKLAKVLIPFIIWSIFFAIFYLISKENFSVTNFLKQMTVMIFGIPTYYHLWFFYQLIGLYLVTPLLIKLIDKLNVKDTSVLLLIFVLQNSFIGTFIKLFGANSFIDIPFSQYSLFYFLLGGLFARINLHFVIKNKSIISILIILSLSINIFGTETLTRLTGKLSGVFMSEDTITVAVYCIGIFVIFLNVSLNEISTNIRKLICYLSSLSFGIYIIHPFVLDFFIKTHKDNNISIIIIIIQFILTCCISILITSLIKSIPFIRRIIP